MIRDNEALVKSIGDVQRKIRELGADLGALGDRRIKIDASGVDEAIGKVATLKRELGGLGDAGGNLGMFGPAGVAQIRDYNRVMDQYGAAMREAAARNAELNASTEKLGKGGADALRNLSQEYRRYGETAAQARQAQAIFADGLIDQANSSQGAAVAMSEHEQAVARLAKTYGMAQEIFAKSDFSKPVEFTTAHMDALRKTLGDTIVGADGAVRHLGALGLVASGMASSGSGGGYSAGGVWPAFAGGGGGGGGAGGGGFLTAAGYADKMMPFIKRWAGIAHYAIMGINEALATILPATMAAGAATLVGWQGVEQMIPRVKAINATAESLGRAYGITSGQYLGTGNTIQHYQNLATGGVYELGGAGINLMRGGSGAVGQVGLSTIAMVDRGVANMQLNMASKGTMGTLSGILGSGTGYLQQFGDIGANLGNIFLGLAPHLPGVGGDYLSALEGITGGLSGGIGFMNKHGMGNVLGAGLAAEAGWRVGTPMLGLASRGIGSLGNLAARIPGLGKSAVSAADIADIAKLTGVDASMLEGGGTGLAGLLGGTADVLGALTGPEVAALAGSAFLGSKLISSMPSAAMRKVSGLQAGIGQDGFSAAFSPLANAIVTTQGLSAPGGIASMMGTMQSPGSFARFGTIGPTTGQVYANAATGFAQTTADLVNAGPQLVTALQKAGLKGVSMADAFQIAQNALLDTTHAFGKDGKLNQTAVQMLSNYGAAIKPMTQSAGGFNAAIAAQQVMGSGAMKSLSTVNQAMDSMTQVMTGGPAGMAALIGMLGGTPVTHTRAGLKVAAGPAYGAMASALGSFTTAAGAGAWNTFAGQNGLISAEQQNLDQLRTYMTLGALPLQGKSGAQGIAGFQLMQMLPLASKSPAALAMLMQQGAQMGVGSYYDPSKSQGQNYRAEEKALANMAGSAAQINKGMNSAVVASSNLPKTAAQFSQSVGADLQSKLAAAASADVVKLKTTLGHAGSSALIGDLVSQFRTAGFRAGPALMAGLNATLKGAGFSAAQIKAIDVKVKADTAQAQAQINGIKGKTVDVSVASRGPAAIQAQIDSIHGKTVTVTVIEQIAAIASNLSPSYGGGIGSLPGGPAGMRIHGQTGMKVPGYGGGDIVPAMLEPGELVVPKHQVAAGLVDHLRGSIPGFAGGGFVGQAGGYFGAGTAMAAFNPAWYAHLLAAGTQGGGGIPHFPAVSPGGVMAHPAAQPVRAAGAGFAVEILKGLKDGMKNATPEAQAAARALVARIGQEIAYAKNISSQMQSGLGLGSMNVDPATGNGPVATQMQSYLTSLQAFSKDLAAVSKGHLSKALISQLVAAGPVQGDALAQSIMGGPGGIGAVNKLWASIGSMSNRVGAQAAMAQYGGTIAPNLRSGTFTTNNVSVSVSLAGGKGGDLQLSNAQISQLVALIQAKLLQQAKRNNKTGVKLPGKGS